MELQILHAIQEIHQGWLTDVMRLFTTIGESGLVWIAIAIVLTMYTEDQKMRSDYDDRNGYYLSGGESVSEKCDRQTQTLRSRQQCHIEDPVSF